MSESYETQAVPRTEVVVPRYSSFWPVLILTVGIILWFGYQAVESFNQNSALANEFNSAVPTIKAAQNAQAKLYALAQDLIQVSAKDPYAAQIVKEANIQIKPTASGANSADATKTP